MERAAQLGYAALALTDECSVAGVVRAHEAAKAAGLQLIVGSEIRLADGPRLVLLAMDRAGYGNLCRLITQGRRAAPKGSYRLTPGGSGGSGCPGVWPCLLPEAEPDPGTGRLGEGRFYPERCWLAVELHAGTDDRRRLAVLTAFAEATGLPLVAAGDVHMHVRARCVLQDTLTAIRLGRPVKDCGQALFPNGERHLRPSSAWRPSIRPPCWKRACVLPSVVASPWTACATSIRMSWYRLASPRPDICGP